MRLRILPAFLFGIAAHLILHLLTEADAAMYTAKGLGTDRYSVYLRK